MAIKEELFYTPYSNHIYTKANKFESLDKGKELAKVAPDNLLDGDFDEWRLDSRRANYVENYIFLFYGWHGRPFGLIDWKQREWKDDRSIKNLKPTKKEQVTFADLGEGE